MFKLDNFGVILFVSFSYTNLLQCSFYENLKNRLKIQKGLCITTKTYNFKRNYLKNYNDSEHAVKTKNTPFFTNFLNINKTWQLFSHWTDPLKKCIFMIFGPEKFLLNMIYIGVILCEESIARISKVWKRFLDPDSGNGVGVWRENRKNFYFRKASIWG
jgi:hypothetical protein